MKHTTTYKPLYGRLPGVFLSGILVMLLHTGYAQNIAINSTGNTADASSMLDVSSTNKGLLIPRVSLTATNVAGPIASPATSLIVYNTATAGVAPNNVVPGYYYWNGTQWVQVITNLTMSNIYTANGNLTSARTVNLNGNTFQFLDNTQAFGGQTRFSYNNGSRLLVTTTTGRADLSLLAGSSSLFLFQDVNNSAQLITGGTSTGLLIGTGSAIPVQITTNGAQRMVITGTGNVGIGGNPAASALLDLSSSSQGFLAPRVALTATNASGPVTSPATGLLVYNTATAGTYPTNVIPGFYYWNNTAWVSLNNTPDAITTKTSNYTALPTDETVLVDASGGNVTITLPSSPVIGKKYTIKKIDTGSNSVTVQPSSGSIDNAANVVGTLPYGGWTVQYNGTNWYIVSRI